MTSIEELTIKNIETLHQCKDFTTGDALTAFEALLGITKGILNQPEKQKSVAKHILEQKYVQLFPKMWKSLSGFMKKKDSHGNYILQRMLGTYANFTDMSCDVSAEFGKSGGVRPLVDALKTYRKKYMENNFVLREIAVILGNTIQNWFW